MSKNRKYILFVVILFIAINFSTANGLWLGNGILIFFTALLGIFAMPVITCIFLYRDALENERKHFFKEFGILALLFLLTNTHAIFGDLDGHGRSVFNLIIFSGLIVVILSSIVAEIALFRTNKIKRQNKYPNSKPNL